MTEAMNTAVTLLGQGMAGIFAVLGIIALVVALLGRMDRNQAPQ